VLRHSKGNKNADATKMLEELEGKPDEPRAAGASARAVGAQAARRAIIREDRAQRLSVEEVNPNPNPNPFRGGGEP
jgi:hypothetical protein